MRVACAAKILLGIVLLASRASGVEWVMFRNIWGNAVVNTDMTPEGRALPAVSLDAPAYYLGRSLGARLGSIPGDVEPPVAEVNAFVTKLLAKSGYLSARGSGQQPSLFIVVQWGYLKPGFDESPWFLGYDPARDIAHPATPILGSLLRNMRAPDVETIVDYAGSSLYAIIVTAFEYNSARTEKPIIYWQTRIGLPAQGKSMSAALASMFIAGAPYFGKETPKPVLQDADLLREGHVKLGELKFLDADSGTSK